MTTNLCYSNITRVALLFSQLLHQPRKQAFSVFLLLTIMVSGCKAPPQPIVKPVARQPIIALALGGGGAKGFAHIGAIKMLEANGIRANIITGTSAGSFVGSLYASGLTPYQMQSLATRIEDKDLMDFTLSNKGFIKGDKLQAFVNTHTKNVPIEKFPKRFAAVATRLDTGAKTLFSKGNAGQAVRASCSIPNVFLPTVIAGVQYVDGGLVSPIPVLAARQLGADIVIAIDISARPKAGIKQNVLGFMDQTLNIMALGQIDTELAAANVVIKPQVGHIGVLDLSQRNDAIVEGEKAASAQIANIKLAIAQFNRSVSMVPTTTKSVF